MGAAVGSVTAVRMAITDLPQMVAAFHSLVGAAAAATAVASYLHHASLGHGIPAAELIASFLASWIGAVTLTGPLHLYPFTCTRRACTVTAKCGDACASSLEGGTIRG